MGESCNTNEETVIGKQFLLKWRRALQKPRRKCEDNINIHQCFSNFLRLHNFILSASYPTL
jgi:hypothetical protein